MASSGKTTAASGLPKSVGIYGDGSDGNVTISTTVNLTRDMFYDTLTVSGTGVLNTSGYRVFCKTSCVVATGGVVSCDGTAASGVVGGSAGSYGNQASLGYGEFQAPGGTSAAAGTAGATIPNSMGGSGGAGGAGTNGAGGAGGVASAPAATTGSPTIRSLPHAILGIIVGQVNRTLAATFISGGGSGGAGGGNGAGNTGGGGGGSGQVMVLASKSIANSGRISANGGTGGTNGGGAGTGGGGGGGGGGGVIFCICDSFTGTLPTATGGAPGAGLGAGVGGTAGSDGTVVLLRGDA